MEKKVVLSDIALLHEWSSTSGIQSALLGRLREVASIDPYCFGIDRGSRLLSEMLICRGLEGISPPHGFELAYTYVYVHRADKTETPLPHYYFCSIGTDCLILDPTAGQLVDFLYPIGYADKMFARPGDRIARISRLIGNSGIQLISDEQYHGLIYLLGRRTEIQRRIGFEYM